MRTAMREFIALQPPAKGDEESGFVRGRGERDKFYRGRGGPQLVRAWLYEVFLGFWNDP